MKKNINYKFPYNMGKIPFYYTSLDNPHNPDGIPDCVDFNLDFDRVTGVLIQKYDEKIKALLDKAYKSGSQITGYMDDYELGIKYAKDFLKFIMENEKDIKGCKILEIGCGTGYLLSLLKHIGADVTGVEPGKQAEEGIKKYGITIVNEYFPSDKITEKYDIVIFYNVLEHIADIKPFLIKVRNQLKKNGRIYFAVPDCENSIKCADISMLIHEHYNYFTENSLSNAFAEYMHLKAVINKSNFGSELYGFAVNGELYTKYDANINNIIDMNVNYIQNSANKTANFKRFIIEIDKCRKTLGLYVPSRAINMLSLIKEDVSLENIEFYDDNLNLEGKYFPGFNKSVKSLNDLIKNPSDYVLIMSYTFGDVIKENLKKHLSNRTEVMKYEELG